MIIVMKINFDIDINNEQVPLFPKKRSKGVYLYTSLSVLSHFFLVGLLFSSALFANNIVVDDGDNSIKAIMVDLSQLAAPEQSLVENTPDVQGMENSEIIDNQPIEEPTIEPIIEPIIEPEVVKEEVKPTPLPDSKIVIKQEQKPKKKKPRVQKSSRKQIRQEVVSNNTAPTAVAPSISDNRRFSENPSPISRGQPEYPRRALDMRLDGYVVVTFDVNSEGRVENINIIEANPNNIFNRSVITAMKKWKYQPRPAKNLEIKIIFKHNESTRFE